MKSRLRIDGVPCTVFEGLFHTCKLDSVVVEAGQILVPFEVETSEGTCLTGDAGDWLIRVDGELYPCTDSKFRDACGVVENKEWMFKTSIKGYDMGKGSQMSELTPVSFVQDDGDHRWPPTCEVCKKEMECDHAEEWKDGTLVERVPFATGYSIHASSFDLATWPEGRRIDVTDEGWEEGPICFECFKKMLHAHEMYKALEWIINVEGGAGLAGGEPQIGEMSTAIDAGKAAIDKVGVR